MQRTLPFTTGVVFLVGSAALLLLNLVTDRSTLWAIWPIWAGAMIAAGVIGQARLNPHRLLGLWLGFGGVVCIGLFVLDVWNGGNWWFFWPLGAWVIGSMAIIGLTVNLLDSVPTSRPAIDDDRP